MAANRADPTLPLIDGYTAGKPRRDRQKSNGLDRSNVVYVMTRKGRPCARGYTYTRSEARKIVAKRRFNTKTPHGLIKKHAYEMDVTRKQMAEAIGVATATFDGYIGYMGHRLKPWMIDKLVPVLALTPESVAKIHEAGVACLGWEPKA